MLVRWAIEGRRKLAKPSLSKSEEDQHHRAFVPAPPNVNPSASTDQPYIPGPPVKSETTAQSPTLTAKLDRLHFESDTALAKSSETADDRAMRRIHAEEMASSLRDDKLLSLTGSQVHNRVKYQGKGQNQLPLTQENVQKLQLEAEPTISRNSHELDGHSSMDMDVDPQTQSDGGTTSARPSLLGTRARDSEQTVTGR